MSLHRAWSQLTGVLTSRQLDVVEAAAVRKWMRDLSAMCREWMYVSSSMSRVGTSEVVKAAGRIVVTSGDT